MTDPDVTAAFRWQAGKCRELGSPFTGDLLEAAAASLERGGAADDLVGAWPGDPLADALPLRLAGALHAVVLEGLSAPLAAVYPGAGRPGDGRAAWAAAENYAAGDAAGLAARLASPPQTNETARSLGLFPGLLAIAARFRRPLDLYELGASAGLNLHMDRFAYGNSVWSRPGQVPITGAWRGPPPRLDAPLAVAARAGCDRNPLDPADAADRRRLRAYVWADQNERLQRLEAALDLAAATDVRVERADAADWIEARLARRRAGAVAVIYHSVFWQYPPEAVRRRIDTAIRAAGATATADAPVAWLRLEPAAGPAVRYPVTLTVWPEGETRVLAEMDPHGRWIDWTG